MPALIHYFLIHYFEHAIVIDQACIFSNVVVEFTTPGKPALILCHQLIVAFYKVTKAGLLFKVALGRYEGLKDLHLSTSTIWHFTRIFQLHYVPELPPARRYSSQVTLLYGAARALALADILTSDEAYSCCWSPLFSYRKAP